jgi:hypothetical protein
MKKYLVPFDGSDSARRDEALTASPPSGGKERWIREP